jgi:hypothetical protein
MNNLPTHLTTVDEFEAWQHLPGNDGSDEFIRGRIIPKSIEQDELDIADKANEVISAAPVIADLRFTVAELFA